jgi:YHS domain-containing protein
MLRLIFFVLLILLLYSLLHFLIRDMPSSRKRAEKKTGPDELVQDPYCQTYIPKRSALKKKVGGQVLYFCRKECLKNFVQKYTEKG